MKRYLAEYPERLVTQEELLKIVWQQNFVSDGLLHPRAASGARGRCQAPRFIETASGRGYRFIAPVTPH